MDRNLGSQWSPQGSTSYVPGDRGIESVAQMQSQIAYVSPMSASRADFSGDPSMRARRKMLKAVPGTPYSATTNRSDYL